MSASLGAASDASLAAFHPDRLQRGRSVRLLGITISRLRDGRIVEDYSAFDSLELLKQLGLMANAARRASAAARHCVPVERLSS